MAFEWTNEPCILKAMTDSDLMPRIVEQLEVSHISGYYLAYYTDEVVCGKYDDEKFIPILSDSNLLLELRVFNENSEFRLARPTMDCDFIMRIIDDNKFREKLKNSIGSDFEREFKNRIFDEEHFVDKTTRNTGKNTSIFAFTGERCSSISINKVRMRSYINYDSETGIAQLDDWRIVELIQGVSENVL